MWPNGLAERMKRPEEITNMKKERLGGEDEAPGGNNKYEKGEQTKWQSYP